MKKLRHYFQQNYTKKAEAIMNKKMHSTLQSLREKLSKYGVISGLYFPVFGLNTGKYGPEITSE